MTTRAASSDLAEVYARYSFGVDHQLAEVIESCFAPDGSIASDGGQPMKGRRAISARLVAIADPAVVHHAFNIVVLDEREGEVLARADFTMSRAGSVIASGHYDDSLARVPVTGWAFSRRSVTYTWRASWD